MRRRLAEARVAHLATVGPGGRPHIVPITFALEGDDIYFAVDAKPKRTTDLQRLRNIRSNPSVSVLVDHYEDDWTHLWWVRADGSARIAAADAQSSRGLELLVTRYPQYQRIRPPGPVVVIAIQSITGWAANENPAC